MKKNHKKEKIYLYDKKVGMTIWRALPGWSLAIAIFVSFALVPDKVSEQIKTSFIMVNIIYLVVDTIVRVWHYLERRKNECVEVELEGNRYVSKIEKITFWTIRIGSPIYLIIMSIAAILANI